MHPVSASSSVNVATPTTSPSTVARTSVGHLDVLDHHAEPHQVRHGWLHLTAPFVASGERDPVERPQPRPPGAVLGHVADQLPHLLARGSGSS